MDSQKFTQSDEYSGKTRSKKLLIGVLLVLVLLGLGAGGYYLYQNSIVQQAEIPKEQKAAGLPDEAIAEANAKNEAGDYAGAVKVLEDYIDKSKSDENKYIVYIELGRIHSENEKSQESLAAYQEAEKIDAEKAHDDISFLLGAAQSAEVALVELVEEEGTNVLLAEAALKYHKLTLALLESQEDVNNNQLKEHIQDRIENLETMLEGFKELEATEPSS